MRRPLAAVTVFVLALALFTAGYLAHGLLAGNDELILTGREASGRVELAVRQSYSPLSNSADIKITCEDSSFDADTATYLVDCSLVGNAQPAAFEQYWRVNARTGEVTRSGFVDTSGA